ncbi:MAG: DUF455 family protein [Bdellovibrionales bacterium]|nr:DUF455 family protein [Bdellovibrionales bacterium]
MIAPESTKTQVLVEPCVRLKLKHVDSCLEELLRGRTLQIPFAPGRDVQILPIRELPPKKGLASREGQARLLHDLASIELQAMELGLRTLSEFPNAPPAFRQQLAEVTAEESRHLRLCLEGLDALEYPWGSFPAHIGLWQSVAAEDSLIDRVLIVHRYLEGSGLDASDTLLRRLAGVRGANAAMRAVEVIRREEVKHVQFGSRWYHQMVRDEGLDAADDFAPRLDRLFHRIPRRLEPIQKDLRQSAGFTDHEVEALEAFRQRWLRKEAPIHAHADQAAQRRSPT